MANKNKYISSTLVSFYRSTRDDSFSIPAALYCSIVFVPIWDTRRIEVFRRTTGPPSKIRVYPGLAIPFTSDTPSRSSLACLDLGKDSLGPFG